MAIDLSFYERSPWRVGWDLSSSWALIFATIALALRVPHPGVIAASVLLIGCQQYALQILLHDGQHRTLLSTKSRTDLVCRLFLCYPLFTALKPFRQKHLDHHRWLATPQDPDRYYHSTAGKATLPRFLFFLTGLSSVAGGLGGAAKHDSEEGRDWVTALDWVLVLLVQAGIVLLLTYLGGPWAYPLLWFLPFALVFVAQSLRSFCEHAFPEPDAIADTHRLITYRSNWVERAFLAPNNMNYHAEHHLYPQVPYYRLPALRDRLEATGEMKDVEYRGSYLGFVWRFFRALPIAT